MNKIAGISADIGASRAPLGQDAPVPGRGTNIKRLVILAAILLAVGIGGRFGWWYWTTGRFQESTDDAYVKADSSVIAPKVSGYLKEVLVSDNQPVRAGQILARIDDRDYAVALASAEADVQSAMADVRNIQSQIAQQQAVIAQATATVAVDQANLAFSKQDNSRYVTLAKTGAASVQNAQQAVTKLASAQATIDRDRAAVRTATMQVKVLSAQRAKAQSALARSQAALAQAKLNLGYTTIVAPVDGVVGNRSLRVGQYVQAGTQLMAVVPLHATYVVANFKETQLTHFRKGQAAEVEVDTFPGHALLGRVDSLAPAAGQEFALLPPDNATGNFTKIVQRVGVKITFDDLGSLSGALRPGMSVVATIDTAKSEKR